MDPVTNGRIVNNLRSIGSIGNPFPRKGGVKPQIQVRLPVSGGAGPVILAPPPQAVPPLPPVPRTPLPYPTGHMCRNLRRRRSREKHGKYIENVTISKFAETNAIKSSKLGVIGFLPTHVVYHLVTEMFVEINGHPWTTKDVHQ